MCGWSVNHCIQCGTPIMPDPEYEELITLQDDGLGYERIARYKCWKCGFNNKKNKK